MRSFAYHHVDVFTDRPLEGNQLAIFTEPGDLSDGEMQAIALELNLAETVFVFPPLTANAVARLRIFTPRRELMFAGHPTVGTVATLLSERPNLPDQFTVDEGVGPVSIRVERRLGTEPIVWLTTPPIEFGASVSREEAARIIGLPIADLADIEPSYVSAGSPFLFVALQSREAVDRAACTATGMPQDTCPNVVGVFVFTTAHERSEAEHAVYARMFAPWSGIPEDPATGSATGPLAAYMLRERLLPTGCDLSMVSEQGTRMGRRSLLYVCITHNDAASPTIEVGGNTVQVARGKLTLGAASLA